MTEIKDPLQYTLKAPIEAVQPTQFDDKVITHFITTRNNKPVLIDELKRQN
ncbi:hypothetical protein [Planococcus antarcticus]|uniref:hypothetical protein n=1 Tax=Planococcus antarcticus TaxID=161360 RepID=UPI0002F9F1CF|nr:hypothetical protein [Planococcus antarcticus]